MRLLLFLLIVVPALEIGLFILSGKTIGIWPTIILIIATGFIGAWLAKRQGLRVITDFQTQMARGQLPGDSVLEGFCVFIGGVALVSPGFITDVFGLILLFPASRRMIKAWLKKWLEYKILNGQFHIIKRF